MVDVNTVKDFEEFRKKKNNLLFFVVACQGGALLILMIALHRILSLENESLQNQYTLYCVCGYIIFAWCMLPLILKMMAYSMFYQVISCTQKHKDLAQKRTALIKDIIEKNNLDEAKITEFLDLDEQNTQQPVLRSKDFEIEEVIKLWINDNINHLKMKEKLALKSIQNECDTNLTLYVESALDFCKRYDKNIKAKRFESLIPPMLFDEADITFFNKARETYHR